MTINRDDLRRAGPNVETATTRYVRGEISKEEYERLVKQERAREGQPPQEQTARRPLTRAS